MSITQRKKEKPIARHTSKQAHRYSDIETKKQTKREKDRIRQTDTQTRKRVSDERERKSTLKSGIRKYTEELTYINSFYCRF